MTSPKLPMDLTKLGRYFPYMALFKNCIQYVASPSGPLPSVFKLAPWGQKWPRPGGHMFYIGLYRKNMKKSCLKP